MAIEQAQATGYSFTPQKVTGGVDVQDPLAGVQSGLSNLLGKYAKVKQGNETDFLEAMVDHAAGTIKEQSWLTPDAYTQGLAYSNFIDKQTKLTAALPQLAQETLDAGGDLDAFKTKMKPMLADLTKELENSGLEGEALLAAQKQNITFAASAMDTFQKNREVRLQQAVTAANYKTTNAAVGGWFASGANPQDLTGYLNGAFEQLKANNANSTDPIGVASNFISDTVKSLARRANPATPYGQQAIQGIAMFANSEVAQGMSPKAYNELQEILSDKQQAVMDYNGNVMEQELTEAERMFDSGQLTFTTEDFSRKYKEYQVAGANGTIEFGKVTQLINKLQTLEQKTMKDSQGSMLALSGSYAQRQALFGSDADSKSTDLIVKHAAKQFGEDYDGAAKAIISAGVNTQNGHAVTAGFKQYMPQVEVLLSTKPEDFTKGTVDGTHVAAYQGFVKQIQSLQRSNPYMLSKALAAVDDKDTRDAMEAYFGTGPNVGKNVQFDMKEIQRYKDQIIATRQGGGLNGAASKGGGFTAEDLKSGFFASHMWPLIGDANSGKATSWWNNPSDDVLAKRAQVLNQAWDAARPELAVMEAQGQVLMTPSQKIRALRELGRLVPMDTGFVTANKGWRDSLRVGNSTERMKDELVQSSLEVIRDRFYNKFNGYGDRNFKKEDVQMTVVGNELLISATDSSGQRMTPLQRYGVSVVNETGWQIIESRKKDGGRLPIGTVATGAKQFTVTKDWQDAFGPELAKDMAASMVRYEGNISDVRATDKSRPNVRTTSIGIRMDGTHPEWEKKILAARANGTEDQVVGSFVKDYFKNYNQYLKAANLPEAKNLSLTGLKSAYIGMAHAMWQGGPQGGGNTYANIIKTAQQDPNKAVDMFYQSALFKDIDSTSGGKGKNHPRTAMYLQGIQDVAAVYNARAVAGLKSGKFQDAFTKGSYPTMASGVAGFKSDVKPYKPTGKDINTYAKEALTKPTYPLQVSGPEGFN